jgi:DNA modification methylase
LIFERDPKLFQEVFDGRLPVTRAKRIVHQNIRRDQARAVARSGRLVHPDECMIIVGDAVKESEKLPRGKFRLIFEDPPYNLGFAYDADPTRDQLSPAKYLDMIRRTVQQGAELLTPDGTYCLMICEEWVVDFGLILREAGLHVRRLIVWHESFGQAGHNNFGRTCRFIWYAVKNPDKFVFDAASILTESKRSTVYADKRAMPNGKVPDALWDFSRIAGTFSERMPDAGIPTQLPIDLVKRAVRCFTEVGDSVLDRFGGTGTTARAAIQCGRKCVTVERSKRYAAIIKRELLRMSERKG